RAPIERLEELRLAALERRIEADLALGRHAELVGELEELLVDHPLREQLREQLMLALYRSGRQAEALHAYRRARELLVREFGIEPAPALQQLERRILVQDPAPDALDAAPLAPDLAEILERSAADIAVVSGGAADWSAGAGVVVPFGGAENDWAALELGAWLASAGSAPLRLLGTRADPRSGR